MNRLRAQEIADSPVLESLPVSRALFERWQNEPMPKHDPLEWAVRFYYLNRLSINVRV